MTPILNSPADKPANMAPNEAISHLLMSAEMRNIVQKSHVFLWFGPCFWHESAQQHSPAMQDLHNLKAAIQDALLSFTVAQHHTSLVDGFNLLCSTRKVGRIMPMVCVGAACESASRLEQLTNIFKMGGSVSTNFSWTWHMSRRPKWPWPVVPRGQGPCGLGRRKVSTSEC